MPREFITMKQILNLKPWNGNMLVLLYENFKITRTNKKLMVTVLMDSEGVIHEAGPLFTKKTPSYGYRDPYYKPKTVWRPSQVYNGNPYTDKTASS